MADTIDMANDKAQNDLDLAIKVARREIPPGEPGECEYCGYWFSRLINSACGRCRDLHKLA